MMLQVDAIEEIKQHIKEGETRIEMGLYFQ